MKKQRIAIIIPAFNEASAIQGVIRDLKLALAKAKMQADIIVVDDGSKDATAKKAAKEGAIVIQHVLNIGAGGATATGIHYVYRKQYNLAATIDADGQHSPPDLVEGLRQITTEHTDLLLGSRLIDAKGMSTAKQLGNRGLSLITRLLFGVSVTDSQSGLRIFSAKALECLRWKTDGYEFCSEMLWRAKQRGLNIREYPIKAIYTDYSKTKGQNNWNGFYLVKTLIRQRLSELVQ